MFILRSFKDFAVVVKLMIKLFSPKIKLYHSLLLYLPENNTVCFSE